jgi:hypothetical protein
LYLCIRFLRLPVIQAALSCLWILLLASTQDAELQAQQTTFRPHVGLYLPTRISTQDGVLHIRQKIGVTVGARVTVSFNDRFDVITALTYMPGYVALHRSGEQFNVGSSAHSLSAGTGARYWLLPPSAGMLSWEVHTGLGVGMGGQAAYKDLFENAVLTGVVGTAVRYQVGQLVSLTLKVQERLCRIRLGGAALATSRSPFDVSFGLGLPFLEGLR